MCSEPCKSLPPLKTSGQSEFPPVELDLDGDNKKGAAQSRIAVRPNPQTAALTASACVCVGLHMNTRCVMRSIIADGQLIFYYLLVGLYLLNVAMSY